MHPSSWPSSVIAEKNPVIVIIAGPNGAGKTSLTQDLLYHKWVVGEGCEYINPDEIARDVFGDWNSPEAMRNAAIEAARRREKCLEHGRSLVFESVMSAPDKIDFLRRAKAAGYFIRLFYVGTDSPAICAARVAQRVMLGGHTVPIEKIISRWTKSITNCALAAQFLDRAYIYDNSVDGEKASRLFRTVDGSVQKIYVEHLNAWAKEVLSVLPLAEQMDPPSFAIQ